MNNLKRSKKYKITGWSDWVGICREIGDDPYEVCETGRDIGGGDSIIYEYLGDYPDRDEEEGEEKP